MGSRELLERIGFGRCGGAARPRMGGEARVNKIPSSSNRSFFSDWTTDFARKVREGEGDTWVEYVGEM